jgi:competence protein ComEC
MFVAAVLALSCGIALEAYWRAPVAPLFFAVLGAAAAIPLFTKWGKACALLTLAAFMLCGALRLSLVAIDRALPDNAAENSLYEGLVMESSPRVKVLSLSRPDAVKGMRVVFPSEADLDVSQRVKVLGKIRPLVPSFKNPGSTSWKWLKKLEGVAYELRGKAVSAAPAYDPVAAVRRHFVKTIRASGAPRTDILLALTIGDRTGVPQETNDLFLRTGAVHVLVMNGFKLSMISGFFFFIVRFAFRRVRRFRLSGQDARYAALVAIPFPVVFMLVAGSGVPLIRATIMVIVLMVALFLQRKRHYYNTLAMAALVILLIYPHSLLTASFQLTFMCLIFIVICMGRLAPALNKIRSGVLRWPCSIVLSTAAATLGSAPIVVYYFYGISSLPLLPNLITVSLMGVGATGLGLLGMIHPCGRLLLVLAGYLTQANLAVLRALDFGYLFPLIRPCFTEIVLYYCLFLALLFVNRKAVAALLFFVLLPLCAIQAYADYRERFNHDLRINFIDVGQGDSALIEAPGGMRILIDGGGFPGSDFDMGKQVIAPFLLYRKVRTVDYVINTHPHADHIGGLSYVLQHFRVLHLVTGGVFPAERKFLELADIARKQGVERLIWRRGDGIKTSDFRMDTLYPAGKLPLDNLNETSLVFHVQYGRTTFLLPADITADVEEELVLSGVPLKSDVLKLPHHGSGTSNTFAFIHAVKPRLGIVSASEGVIKNLPSPEALRRYDGLSIPLLRTDRQGLIEVRSDGSEIRWSTHGNL